MKDFLAPSPSVRQPLFETSDMIGPAILSSAGAAVCAHSSLLKFGAVAAARTAQHEAEDNS